MLHKGHRGYVAVVLKYWHVFFPGSACAMVKGSPFMFIFAIHPIKLPF